MPSGKFVYTDVFLTIDGVDLSDHIESVTLARSKELLDATCMSDTSRSRVAGYEDWSMDVSFRQNFAAAKVDATIEAAFSASTSAAIVMRPESAVVGTDNPEFTGNAWIENYQPIAASVGQVANASVTLQGDGALARAVA